VAGTTFRELNHLRRALAEAEEDRLALRTKLVGTCPTGKPWELGTIQLGYPIGPNTE
jgi:hypothetical protein